MYGMVHVHVLVVYRALAYVKQEGKKAQTINKHKSYMTLTNTYSVYNCGAWNAVSMAQGTASVSLNLHCTCYYSLHVCTSSTLYISLSPTQDLFTYLSEKGIDTEEHDIMTHFPRRALWELDHSLSFREASLYPSVTVFVQDQIFIVHIMLLQSCFILLFPTLYMHMYNAMYYVCAVNSDQFAQRTCSVTGPQPHPRLPFVCYDLTWVLAPLLCIYIHVDGSLGMRLGQALVQCGQTLFSPPYTCANFLFAMGV